MAEERSTECVRRKGISRTFDDAILHHWDGCQDGVQPSLNIDHLLNPQFQLRQAAMAKHLSLAVTSGLREIT